MMLQKLNQIPIPNSSHFEYLCQQTKEDKNYNHNMRSKSHQRISLSKKQQLLHSIVFKNMKIKQAAQELKINYSSAKTILRSSRKKKQQQYMNQNQQQTKLGSSYKQLDRHDICEIDIISSIGGQKVREIKVTQSDQNHFQNEIDHGNILKNNKLENCQYQEQFFYQHLYNDKLINAQQRQMN